MEQRNALAPVTAAWSKEKGTGVPHPLVCHAMDTAAVAELLYPIVLGPGVRTDLEEGLAPLEGDSAKWVAVLCGVHDLGKLSPVFQAQCSEIACSRMPNGQKAIWAAKPATQRNPRMDMEHGLATAVHLQRFLKDRKVANVVIDNLVCALGGHHGYFPEAESLKSATGKRGQLGTSKWERARDELLDTVAVSWGLPPMSQADWTAAQLSLRAAVGLAGLTTLCDWIASDRKRFAWQPDVTDAFAYGDEARTRAREIVAGLCWQPWQLGSATFTELFSGAPRAVQQEIAEFVADQDRPGALVVEAPTGEGKTKAALHTAAMLAHQLGMSGLYVGMPTKATGHKVYREVNAMLERSGSPLRAVLAHAGALAEMRRQDAADKNTNSSADKSKAVVPEGVCEDADCAVQKRERVAAREFFTRDGAAAAPIGVGTIDQALQGVLRSKRSYLRLASLSGKVLVLDEVHGYEVYTSRLLDRLMWWCGKLGIPVVLLSATLPADRKEKLLLEWQSGANGLGLPELQSTPDEPSGWRATWVDEQERKLVPLTTSQEARCIALHHLGALDKSVKWGLDQVGTEGSAMFVLDTRTRAETAFGLVQQEIKNRGLDHDAVLVMGKLDNDVRHQREKDLYERLGWNATGSRKIIAVGTQVLENLDLDVDLLVSDPCPTDRLIQRTGRLHRYMLGNRPVAKPMLGIAGMQGQESRPVSKLVFPSGVATVHGRSLLEASWAVMSDKKTLVVPDEVPDLVHRTYVTPPDTRKRHEAIKRAVRDEYRADEIAIPRSEDRLRDLTDRPDYRKKTRQSGRPEDIAEES